MQSEVWDALTLRGGDGGTGIPGDGKRQKSDVATASCTAALMRCGRSLAVMGVFTKGFAK